jgi:hypothetical protein
MLLFCRNRFHKEKPSKDQAELDRLRLVKYLVWKIERKVAQYLMMAFSYHSNAIFYGTHVELWRKDVMVWETDMA